MRDESKYLKIDYKDDPKNYSKGTPVSSPQSVIKHPVNIRLKLRRRSLQEKVLQRGNKVQEDRGNSRLETMGFSLSGVKR